MLYSTQLFTLFCIFSSLTGTTLAASQASTLLKQAHQLKNGQYCIQNVATGQRLTGNRNNLYPAYGKGTPVSVVSHTVPEGRHTILGLGQTGERKCLSAQYDNTAGTDGASALYSCAVGLLAAGNVKSGLRPAKQEFILIPAGNNFKRGIATEASADLEERSIFSDEELDFGEGADSRKMVRKQKRATAYGPYYMIATDHLTDQAPRAIVNQIVVSLGQRVMKLVKWQKGAKNQMWEFIPC